MPRFGQVALPNAPTLHYLCLEMGQVTSKDGPSGNDSTGAAGADPASGKKRRGFRGRSSAWGGGERQAVRADSNVLTKYASRLSRETAIYAIGMMVIFPIGFVQVAVFTQTMTPTQYGQLAVLMTFAGMLTLIMNTGPLQGTFLYTFGSSGDADGGDISAEYDDPDAMLAADKRKSLGTGLFMSIGICAVIAAPIVIWASTASNLLLGSPNHAGLIIWTTASAVLGALWRLTVTALRHERRPVLFSIGTTLRPVLVVGLSAPLVATGHGVQGALIGTTVGTFIGILYCFAVDFRSYKFAFSREDAVHMLKLGASFIPIVSGLFVVHDADLYLVAWYASTADAGIYRLASRIATLPSYTVSAFMIAQSSLERSALFQATYERRGLAYTKSTLLTYYLLFSFFLVLLLGVGANLLVQIAAPSYAAAAGLIPVLGIAYTCYGGYIVVIRASQMPRRRMWYQISAIANAVLFVLPAMLVIPAIGSVGAPICESVALVTVASALLALGRHTDAALGFQTGRVLRGIVAGVLCYALGTWVAALLGIGRYPVEVLSLLLYPVLLVAFEAIPRHHLDPLGRIVRATMPRSRRSPLLDRLPDVPPRRRIVVEELVRDRRSPRAVAADLGISEHEVGIRLARALRQMTGAGEPDENDGYLGTYLLAEVALADRDSLARELGRHGIDPLDIHELDMGLAQLRRTPRRAWRRPVRGSASRPVRWRRLRQATYSAIPGR
jgi:O-antigen/teichoic acid export membrane protein